MTWWIIAKLMMELSNFVFPHHMSMCHTTRQNKLNYLFIVFLLKIITTVQINIYIILFNDNVVCVT